MELFATPVEWYEGSLGRSLRGRHLSMKVSQRSPIFGYARLGRSHRDLRRAAGNERGEDHPDGVPVRIAGSAPKQQTIGPTGALRSGCDTGIGWVEAETVCTLDRGRSLAQPASQVQEFYSAAAGGEPSSEAPLSMRGQRRGYEQASGLEVEDRVHAQEMLLRTKRSVNASHDHFNDPARSTLRVQRRLWPA